MANKAKVLVTRNPPIGGLDKLKAECDVQVWPHENPIPKEEFYSRVAGVHALFVHPPDRIDEALLNAAGPQLKVIGTMSAGLDHIDIPICRKRNVLVGYTPNVLSGAVADLTIGLLLSASRRFKEGFSAVTDGGWGTWDNASYLCGHEVHGSTVGIVGLGSIGLAVAKRLTGFGVNKILYSGNTRKSSETEVGAEFVPFDDLLRNSDFVIACCSMNKENKGLFNKNAFSKMKKSAVFVNTTRGALVDQDDLYEALTSGQIYAAGIDVSTPEPMPHDCPLLKLKNCIITPHIGSATWNARNQMCKLTVGNIMAGLKGEPLLAPV